MQFVDGPLELVANRNLFLKIRFKIDLRIRKSTIFLLSWLNPLLEGGPMQEGRLSCLLAGLQPY